MKGKNRSFFVKILVPMFLLIVIEVALLVYSVFGGGLIEYMEHNEIEILHERVLNRKSYLETEMVTKWADVDRVAEQINEKVQALSDSGEISIKTLDSSSEAAVPLIKSVAQDLISMMRTNKVTGAFLVLNTQNLEEAAAQGIYKNKPGIYIRDYDPTSNSTKRNMDLLLEYAPPEVVKSLNISLDKSWTSQFEFEALGEYSSYLYEPFQAAVAAEDKSGMKATDFGRWNEAYQLYRDDVEVISYSVPLFLEDGTVYGVLGVDLSLAYLRTLLPWRELENSEAGSYLLGIAGQDGMQIENVLIHGEAYQQINGGRATTVLYEEKDRVLIENDLRKKIYCDVQELTLYDANAAFAQERWVLVGIVDEQYLFSFSHRVMGMLIQVTLYTLFTGVVGAVVVSIFLSRPVLSLTKSVQNMKPFDHVKLVKTGIREIDLLAESLEKLNEETLYEAEKFSYIIHTSKLPIAVFEANREDKTVFVTGRLFEMLGMPELENTFFPEDRFREILSSFEKYRQPVPGGETTERLYRIPLEEAFGETVYRYIRLSMKDKENHSIGFVEDVTENEKEKAVIEYERDHDLLTGLLNRRAFNRRMEQLFAEGEAVLKTAALVMIDLDSLKHINDTYGHDYGDKYIQTAAGCFIDFTPENTLISRLSGDEFHLFFYGYDNREQIRKLFEQLQDGIRNMKLHLPDGTISPVLMSAGVAWYPEDSVEYASLHTYSDEAMYHVKHGVKNQWGEFQKDSAMIENFLI